MSSTLAATTSAASTGKFSISSACMAGMHAAPIPPTAYESTAVARNPQRSTRGPETNPTAPEATAPRATRIPVCATLPVVCSTNHGTATTIIASPTEATATAPNRT